jgi:hypothetical protein
MRGSHGTAVSYPEHGHRSILPVVQSGLFIGFYMEKGEKGTEGINSIQSLFFRLPRPPSSHLAQLDPIAKFKLAAESIITHWLTVVSGLSNQMDVLIRQS